MKNRIIQMLLGNFIIGLGISIQVIASLGIDPGMTFYFGITKIFHISLGIATLLSNCVFIIPLVIFDHKRIGIATIVNMTCIGFIVDFFSLYIFKNIVVTSFISRILIMLIGILFHSFGVALYSNADMGQSPLDGIPNVLVKITHKGSYRVYRVIQDTLLVVIGFLCGSQIGIGTIMLMTMVGPCIHFFSTKLKASA
ncbi:YczE/YyaS/YitT family protein [Floccifex sp.]|uniref:YczE/YyaS/YitT family protein n=1 Tax=Floccifex sp. TaxID=2815810 RepID=UPI003F112B0D